MDVACPGSFIHGIFQARILETFPTPGDIPNPAIVLASPALAGGFFATVPPRNPLHGLQSYGGKGACITQWSYEPTVQGHPIWISHSEEFWQKVVHWRRKWQTTLAFLLQEPYEQYKKAKRYDTGRCAPPPGEKVSKMLLGKNRRAITNSSRKNEAAGPKWKWRSAVDVSGGESKVWYCKEQHRIGTWIVRLPWIKVNWPWSSKRWKE